MNRRDCIRRLGLGAAVSLSPLLDGLEILAAPSAIGPSLTNLAKIDRILTAIWLPYIEREFSAISPLWVAMTGNQDAYVAWGPETEKEQ